MAPVDLPRPAVPASIAAVRDFVNTTDHETGADDLANPEDLSTWLLTEGHLPSPASASAEEFALALRLRAGLRQALEDNHHRAAGNDPVRAHALADARADARADALADAVAELPVSLTWTHAGPTLVTNATGVLGALATIGLAAHQAATDRLWWRLKICVADDCAWAYYDHSKNRSRNWCEYGCGNKVKTRAYRARQRSAH